MPHSNRTPDSYFLTDEEREIIRKNYPTLERCQLQALLPRRSWNSIRSAARRLKLRRKAEPARRWKPDDDHAQHELPAATRSG
ncbi:hypothetical protein FH063_002506 [Azospirillum argentinense]|uniref:Uncharacterized protein n=1 Tax=Azospirillum argentinense TaxID=2970906 RepID=A0A5B0KSZ4_9PROT|nr:hypothetical protein FH063_002506 [Azospirillum argentinense]